MDADLLTGSADLPQELNEPEYLLKPTPFLKDFAAHKAAFFSSAKVHMDRCIDAVEPKLKAAIGSKDTSAI